MFSNQVALLKASAKICNISIKISCSLANNDLENRIIHLLYEQNITEIFEGDQMTYTTYLAHFNDGECHITHDI